MSFLQGPNGEDVLPIKIGGVHLPVDMNRAIAVHSTAQGKDIHYAHSASIEEVEIAIKSSYQSFLKWKKSTPTERRDLLLRVADIMKRREETFIKYQQDETSCQESWARFNLNFAVRCIREIASNISGACAGEIPALDIPGGTCLVYKESIGPVLAIPPWNATVILAARALTGPIATGSTVLLKASELSPRTHHYLVEAFEAAGLPAGCINVIQSRREDAAAVTEAIISNPIIRKVEFIGSAAVGRLIGQVSAKYLKPVLLELGGKAPSIILKDADIIDAARKVADGATLYHGQICMSTDRIIVVEEVAQPFIEELKRYTSSKYADGAGWAVTQNHAKRAHDLFDEAHKSGASFIVGNNEWRDASKSGLRPTIITGIKKTDAIFHEELFCPGAILTVVKDEEEAIEVANDTVYGLSASVHSKDLVAALRVARQIESGQVYINNLTTYDQPTIPLGGVKGSGWGRTNGKYILNEFLVDKTVIFQDPTQVGKDDFGK
ncbi:aldehyde dehydrogenase domain-containing protein [Xylogone sp. PMI_703]|nr:aldehyde dehydrogenase domain-containing protein [Xylogone sp. PMI_703]